MCEDCNCKYDYIKTCAPVSVCVKSIALYVGLIYADKSVVISALNVKTRRVRHGFALVDAAGFAVSKELSWLNVVEGGLYEISALDPITAKQICLELDCKFTQRIRFEVILCNDCPERHTLNMPCAENPTECAVILNLTDVATLQTWLNGFNIGSFLVTQVGNSLSIKLRNKKCNVEFLHNAEWTPLNCAPAPNPFRVSFADMNYGFKYPTSVLLGWGTNQSQNFVLVSNENQLLNYINSELALLGISPSL